MLVEGFNINLNALGHFVRIIVEGVGIVGVGVIVFTLILKAITTPFDVYQRIKMRKQTLIMKKMQPELEKLQKQYANDKNTYSMKMMELQKKNGYSMFGACLPMLISMAILIIAVWSFQSYAQYANLQMYRGMAESYNAAVKEYAVDGIDYRFASENGEEAVISWDYSTQKKDGDIIRLGDVHTEGDVSYTIYKYENSDMRYMRVESTAKTVYLYYTYELDSSKTTRSYYINLDKFYYEQENESLKAEIKSFIEEYTKERADEGVTVTENDGCVAWFQRKGAQAAAESFRSMNNPSFLWVKNVWYPDVSFRHPIQDYSTFTKSITSNIVLENGDVVKISSVFNEPDYNSLTSQLSNEKKEPNGYFILIAITIGLMVLQQFIMMKSQKESNQFQTVDGQGAQVQKMMMIMMPLIYAITGFLWTAAFSIYIAVSSIFGIVITLVSNLIIGKLFEKQEKEELKARYTRTVPWKKDEQGKKKK